MAIIRAGKHKVSAADEQGNGIQHVLTPNHRKPWSNVDY